MTACTEPGCLFPAHADRVEILDRAGSPLSVAPDGRCRSCYNETPCSRCNVNVQQQGGICRPCARIVAPGAAFLFGQWLPHQHAIVTLMRRPEFAGVKWSREGDRIVGRLDALVISLKPEIT